MTILTGTDRNAAAAISPDEGRVTLQCADRPGVVAAVTGFLAERNANILESDQTTTDPDGGPILMRVVFRLPALSTLIDELREEFGRRVVEPFDVEEWRITQSCVPKRVAVMVSRFDHCLMELVWRWRRGELPVDIGLVISNHADLGPAVRSFGLPFVHIPVTADTKAQAEAEQLRLLTDNFDLVVLARYMQVLSTHFLREVGCPVINIHHSFLPAFVGASPYTQAHARGVKLIGATAHYATEDLDEGPIIEQDVARVSHDDSVASLQRRGADIERAVFVRAVQWHCEDRVLRRGNTTVVFT